MYKYIINRDLHRNKKMDPLKAMMQTVVPLSTRTYATIVDMCILVVPLVISIIVNVAIGIQLLDPLFVTIIIATLVLTAVFLVVFVFYNNGVTPGYKIFDIIIVSTLTGEQVSRNEYIKYLFTGSFSVVPRVKGMLEVYNLLSGEYNISLSMKQACVIPVKKKVYDLLLHDYGLEGIKKRAAITIEEKPSIF